MNKHELARTAYRLVADMILSSLEARSITIYQDKHHLSDEERHYLEEKLRAIESDLRFRALPPYKRDPNYVEEPDPPPAYLQNSMF